MHLVDHPHGPAATRAHLIQCDRPHSRSWGSYRTLVASRLAGRDPPTESNTEVFGDSEEEGGWPAGCGNGSEGRARVWGRAERVLLARIPAHICLFVSSFACFFACALYSLPCSSDWLTRLRVCFLVLLLVYLFVCASVSYFMCFFLASALLPFARIPSSVLGRPKARDTLTAFVQVHQKRKHMIVTPPCSWCGLPTGCFCDACRKSVRSACDKAVSQCVDCAAQQMGVTEGKARGNAALILKKHRSEDDDGVYKFGQNVDPAFLALPLEDQARLQLSFQNGV
eukprot:s2508_g1.t1